MLCEVDHIIFAFGNKERELLFGCVWEYVWWYFLTASIGLQPALSKENKERFTKIITLSMGGPLIVMVCRSDLLPIS
jgi:hypothetical protein